MSHDAIVSLQAKPTRKLQAVSVDQLVNLRVRRLRSFVQIVWTRLPSQAMNLAVRVGGKESNV